MSFVIDLVESWNNRNGNVNSLEDIKAWVDSRNAGLKVDIHKMDFSYDGFWYYDEEDGYIKNRSNSFFQIAGYQKLADSQIVYEQPVIIQDEIGYLGIICKKIDGVLNFLMQAKIEPGNINVIQISPTIQATKSNFIRMHGGKTPDYLDYFVHTDKYNVIVDQIQSEQSSRFYKKRNRNIIIEVDSDVEVLPSHMWMTLGQIKELMKIDNLVNMDTRTVLSCIPFRDKELSEGERTELKKLIKDEALYESLFECNDLSVMHGVFSKINDYKMYDSSDFRLLPVKSLKSWDVNKKEIVCKSSSDFKVVYCHIEIEGREVKYWEQPLLEAIGEAVFGMFTTVDNGVRKYLVEIKPEIGCFDGAELGPTIQLEPSNSRNRLNCVERLFLDKLNDKKCDRLVDVVLSEEGGRFYHEQNRNAIIEIDKDEIVSLPDNYFWLDLFTINTMVQFNNCLNIQLRNLIALIDF